MRNGEAIDMTSPFRRCSESIERLSLCGVEFGDPVARRTLL
jgi:hypothetical protein